MMKKPANKEIGELLEQLQAQVTALAQRLELLEAGAKAPVVPAVAPAPAPVQAKSPAPVAAPAQPAPTEEEFLAISAALAAYLGVRLRIKQIRLVSSAAWAQQGRVSIQASHRLHN
jgi:methylmalonyl-CoA carboxyltransferase 12S subunit